MATSSGAMSRAPLHHLPGRTVSLGGAVAGGSRIAVTRGVHPTEFGDEVHRYGAASVRSSCMSLTGYR
jgi:hypothetical protein